MIKAIAEDSLNWLLSPADMNHLNRSALWCLGQVRASWNDLHFINISKAVLKLGSNSFVLAACPFKSNCIYTAPFVLLEGRGKGTLVPGWIL